MLNGAIAVIAANIVALVLVSAIAVMKMRSDRRVLTATPRRLRIAIDMDEVMADALAEHLRRYNVAFGTELTSQTLKGWHLEHAVPPAHRAAAEAMIDADFFEDLAVLPECREVVGELAARHDVFVVTAAMDVPCSFDAKYRWLRRHFPFIAPSHIVFCGDKSIVDADYLIDDRPRHLQTFKGRGVLFSAPHNFGEQRFLRVESWKEVRVFFGRIDHPAPLAAADPLGSRNVVTTA